jgi:nucleoid-associated protein YgaU
MTRETKIGLLVGLAFIIVIGILLSDQLMRSTEPPPAPLATVGDTLRKGTVTPASSNPPITRVVPQPADASPETAVPTKDEITRPQPPVTIVEIKPGANAAGGGNVVIGPGNSNYSPAGQQGLPIAPAGQAGRAVGLIGADDSAAAARKPAPGAGDGTRGRSIADVAAAMGETLVGPDGQPLRANPQGLAPMPPVYPVDPRQLQQQQAREAAATAGVKQYKAEAGDSLSKIAARFLGADTKANREAIVKANPFMAENPEMIIAGRTYTIPGGSAAAQAQAPTQSQPRAAAPKPQQPAAERAERTPIKASAAEYWYQVQKGDTLMKIAKEQLGDVHTVAAIKELNREHVKDWNKLLVGTKLRLPAKPVAMAR